MKISEQIKLHRKDIGLTQEQIANYLGVSTPAVNKWEKGSTFPDISLLPALARLLKIDMNELFSFCEELTEIEIAQFSNELSQVALNKNIDSAFQIASKKIQEYPHCDSLIYMAATILNAALTLSATREEKKKEYEKKIMVWLEQTANSQDEKIRFPAIYMLATKYIQLQDHEKANLLLEKVPDINIDKAMLQVNILMQQEDNDAAAILLEGKILQVVTRLQGYLYKLIEIEEQTGNHFEADQITEIADKMVSLFGLWNYGSVVPHLLLATYRKDVEQCVRLIKIGLEEAQRPWSMKEYPLYYRYPAKKSFENIGHSFINAIISEIETQKEYEFLKDNEEVKKILTEYGK